MKRVASLYLPHWSIDRVRRAERHPAPPPDAADPRAERTAGDAPRITGWRPGAKWARGDGATMPFKRLPGDDGSKSSGWVEPVHDARVPASVRPEPVEGRRGTSFDRLRANGGRGNGNTNAPLVTIHKIGSRVEIAAACPAAVALGVIPGMALTQARASVPDLDIRDADPEGDRADLSALAITLSRHWCPVVAIADAESLFLDVTGTAHLHGGEAAMARRIVRLLARLGIAARIAVADTTGAAWALARHTPGGLWPTDRHLPALAPLPVAALRIDDAATERLRRLGIESVGDLLAISRAPLVRRFGPVIARRVDQATGALPEPLDPVIPPTRIVVTRRFAEPIATAEAIQYWLGPLVADLARALAESGQGARALLFAVERVDASVQKIRIGLARPTRDAAHILRLIARRIETIDPGYGVDALTLHVHRADPLGAEAIGVVLEDDATPDLAPLIDTLANRIGAAKLWRTRPIESDVPERSVAPLPPLDAPARGAAPLRADDVRRLDARTPDHPWHPRWPRPVRLLRRPERIDHVLAELPDFPPLRFTWRGTTHRIVRGDGPERITGEWWKRGAERDAVRDYFRVEDERGHRFWLFRRGDGRRAETGDLSWYMHGTFG